MATVVLDTNVLLALYLFRDPAVSALRTALESGELVPVRSAATDGEYAEVLARPGLFDVAPDRQAALRRDWAERATLVGEVRPAPRTCRDPLDQKFLDLAVTAGATWLITRDRDLLKLNRKFRGTGLCIATPLTFAKGGPEGSP
ncbi:MAG: putative toxin-antitoxin system toxin component, PIN family [Gammaproteobacteria bacterium]|nr:putative toxin-antitoxin system toxin component, PIN family [Gammaproteobacteria bacterium]